MQDDDSRCTSSVASTASSSSTAVSIEASGAHDVPPVPVSLIDRRWRYRGEGGANLVLSLPDQKMIVRFAKSKYVGLKDQDTKIGEIAFYANEVMRPLLGSHFVRPLEIGIVANEDFEHVRVEAQPFRPLSRIRKDINSRRVILSPDCVFLTPTYEENTIGDTFSFEIKPKQGWHSLKATCATDLCHRCLKQYAKLHRGEIDTISMYCPLDLFSGDETRMKRAIFDLFESPSNRFKVFKNGNIVYTDRTGSLEDVEREVSAMFGPTKILDSLAALLITSLTAPIDSQPHVGVPEALVGVDLSMLARGKTCDTRSCPLPGGCILDRVLALQKHADISDHEAKLLCERMLNSMDDIEGLHRLLLWHPNANSLEGVMTPVDIENVVQLQRFLLSVTAKDVSLLLTFRQIESLAAEAFELAVVSVAGKHFRLMISVIDLDPKPVHRISTWVENKEDWLEAYSSSLQ